jgi:hypothetical protein
MFTPFAFVKQATGGGGSAYGPLTTAFLAASGITDATISSALNTFETGLGTYSIPTSNFLALYPLVGGTSATCAWNFMDTTQYNLTYTGSITFSTDGIQVTNPTSFGNYAMCSTVPTKMLDATLGHNAVYTNTNNASLGTYACLVGSNGDHPGSGSCAPPDYDLTQYYFEYTKGGGAGQRLVWPTDPATGAGNGQITANVGSNQGFWQTSRTSKSYMAFQYNGSVIATNTTALNCKDYSNYNTELVTFPARAAAPEVTAAQRVAWFSVGKQSFTDQQAADYYTLVQAFQTTLGRQV